MGTAWSEKEDTLLTRLDQEGRLSAAGIAIRLAEAGFPARSRNAVIGRLTRLQGGTTHRVNATQWTATEDDLAERLVFVEGLTCAAAAAELARQLPPGRSGPAVLLRLRALFPGRIFPAGAASGKRPARVPRALVEKVAPRREDPEARHRRNEAAAAARRAGKDDEGIGARAALYAQRGLALPPGVPFLDRRTDQCAFPLWHSGEAAPVADRLVCGAPVQPGSAYCPVCHAIAWISPDRRERGRFIPRPGAVRFVAPRQEAA